MEKRLFECDKICSAHRAFAVLMKDGTGVTWTDEDLRDKSGSE